MFLRGLAPAIIPTYDPSTSDLLDAAWRPSGPDSRRIDWLIKGLKAEDLWDKLCLFYVFGAFGDEESSLLNWKNPATYDVTAVNSPTFTPYRGWAGDGSTARMDISAAPDPDLIALGMGQNNASCMVYINDHPTPTTPNNTAAIWGVGWTGTGTGIRPFQTNTPQARASVQVNSGGAGDVMNTGIASHLGCFAVDRYEAADFGMYGNGSLGQYGGNTSVAPGTSNIGFFRIGGNDYYPGRVFMGAWGQSLVQASGGTGQARFHKWIHEFARQIGAGYDQ